MKTKLFLTAFLVVTVLSVVGCTSTQEQSTPDKVSLELSTDYFTHVNAVTREVEVAKGGTITVILGSNQTTGFQWSEQAQITDATILEQTSHKFVTLEAESGTEVMGASGKEEWTFKALSSGTTIISMEYSRPWESGEKGVWKFSLTVTVKP
jgi:inhibitor of cysteine peptidase